MRDQAVRAHEQAHQSVAGQFATGGASYSYQRGPDGVDYAIGGEVPITLQKGRTPEETISNARTVQAAALAPADPSGQDRAVAAAAGQMASQAQAELATQKPTDKNQQPEPPVTETENKRTQQMLHNIYGLIQPNTDNFTAQA